MAKKKQDAPWDDCKVAYLVENGDPFDDVAVSDGALPKGWTLAEVDGTGARWVAIFRVAARPTECAGRAVSRWLQRIGANP